MDDVGIVRVQRACPFQGLERLVHAALGGQHETHGTEGRLAPAVEIDGPTGGIVGEAQAGRGILGTAREGVSCVHPGEQGVGRHVARIGLDGAPGERLGRFDRCRRVAEIFGMRPLGQLPGGEAVRRLLPRQCPLMCTDLRCHGRHDRPGQLVLQVEQVGHRPVPAVGPDMAAVRGVDELGRQPQAVAGAADRALDDIAHAQLARDLPHVSGRATKAEAGIARDHREVAKARELGDHVLDDAVRQEVLVRVTRHVVEGQHGDRGAHAGCHFPGDRDALHLDPPDLDRLRQVLHRLRAERCEHRIQLAAHLVVDGARDAEPARGREAFEPCRDIDPISQDVVAVDDDVAEIDADAKAQPLVFRPRLAHRHRPLHKQRHPHRRHRRSEFDQQPVAHRLDDPPPGLRQRRVDHLRPRRPQPRDDALLVSRHQPRVADQIGGEDGRQPAFHAAVPS
ncbi:MAG: hypothetical protein R3D25_10985 [Geminicoccaceae bacterium]